jgi:release factor glutamine methyltransferase
VTGALSTSLREAARRLRGIGAGNPLLEAEYLAAHALGIGRVALLSRRDSDPLPPGAGERLDLLLRRRLAREPLQYILGNMPFCELDLAVGPGVLIPRGETEVLVDSVARAAAGATEAGAWSGDGIRGNGRARRPPLVVDVGTGSGAILLALLQRLPGWVGIGTERSPAALVWARRNRAGAARGSLPGRSPDAPIDLSGRAFLVHGELCAGIRRGTAAIVVSNPPYIRTDELPDLAPEIRDHEPREALDGGEDGLEVVRRLIPEAAAALRPGGILGIELAPDQPDCVREWILARPEFRQAAVFDDLAGRRRGVLAWKD